MDWRVRDDIHPGMLTLHPDGLTHGPHPKALAHMLDQPKATTEEYAVMIDARDALEIASGMAPVELSDYSPSWRRDRGGGVWPPVTPRESP